MQLPAAPHIVARYGCPVLDVDREAKVVTDAAGRHQPYSKLILATGSRPHVPDIPGVNLPGVFTFRDLDDAQKLAARRVRSRATVVIGGGLLGLEAARAMRRFHTEVWVVEHHDRLMYRQLDAACAEALVKHVRGEGIRVMLGDGPVQLLERGGRIAGVRLRSKWEIVCDTVVIAAGIRPNIDLALRAGLRVGRGIRVDDQLRTSDPDIFAAGECAEHRGEIHGLVGPGLEQAAVAAHVIVGGVAQYAGTPAASRLKVLNLPVTSVGEPAAEELPDLAREYVFRDAAGRRKLVVRRGRLIGAVAVGQWAGLPRVQEAVMRQARVWPWQLWRFGRNGELWPPEDNVSVIDWPAGATVCNCTGVTRGRLGEALAQGCRSAQDLVSCTGASTVCGSCKPLLEELAGGGTQREPARGHRTLWAGGLAAVALALPLILLPGLPYPDSADLAWRWDLLWRDSVAKQASGFTLASLALVLGVLGLRKRWKKFAVGDFAGWRVVHALVGVLGLAALIVHTGGRTGQSLNLWLSVAMLGALLTGALGALAVSREHSLAPATARTLRRRINLWHVLHLWPLPVLLVFHVLKTYYF
jgi:nitrite reductase (NADH) large subunit